MGRDSNPSELHLESRVGVAQFRGHMHEEQPLRPLMCELEHCLDGRTPVCEAFHDVFPWWHKAVSSTVMHSKFPWWLNFSSDSAPSKHSLNPKTLWPCFATRCNDRCLFRGEGGNMFPLFWFRLKVVDPSLVKTYESSEKNIWILTIRTKFSRAIVILLHLWFAPNDLALIAMTSCACPAH